MADEPRSEETGARGFARGLRETYAKMPPARRRIALGGALAVVVALVAVVVLGKAEDPWRPVARDMVPEDVDAATKAFDLKKIPWKLADGGAVLVPAEKIHDARLALAVNSMPSGRSVGFEIFDESGMGRSAFSEKVNLHRALEGELARTIRHIDGVERVRVHLVTPERRAFKELEVAPSASVVLSLKPGAEMTRDKALAIRQLVAGAVERLSPHQVSIVDQMGRLLTRPEDGAMTSGDGFERQREQEQKLEDRVVRLLEPVVGPGKAMARVAMDLDFSSVVETREDYDPNQAVVRSEREQLDKSANAGATPAGPPGTASNLPGRAGQTRPGQTGDAGREKSDTIRNYEIDKVVTRKEEPLPRVRKLSIAVLVDQVTVPGDKGAKATFRPRNKEELDQLTRLVSHAVGLDLTRGDQIEVTSAPFSPAPGFEEVVLGPDGLPLPEGATDATKVDRPIWEEPAAWIAAGAVALLLIALGVMALSSRARRKREAAALALQQRANVPGLAPVYEGLEQFAAEGEANQRVDRRLRITELRDRAVQLGNEDLHRLAVVFQRWFEEDKEVEVVEPKKEAA